MAWYEQRFTAPGTWTKPANVSTVYVTVVGGGGGGSEATVPGPAIVGTGGGGGGVRVSAIPVTAPVPVTVGAGGAYGTTAAGPGAIGGSSFFGPYEAGGGGGGTAPPAPTSPNSNAPAVGGGGGGRVLAASPIPAPTRNDFGGTGGLGFPGFNLNGGGMRGVMTEQGQYYLPHNGAMYVNGEWFGAGGQGNYKSGIGEGGNYQSPYATVRANTGFGGHGQTNGASGIVIVRWWE